MKFDPTLLLFSAVAALAATDAAIAETLTVTEVVAEGAGGLRVEIPTIEVVDASLDEAAIRAMFEGPDFAGLADGLATLDAAAVRVPEIVIEYDVPASEGTAAGRARIVYRDFSLTQVTDGVARGATVGETEIAGTEDIVTTMGTMSADLLDLGAILGFYGFGDAPRGDEMTPLYENFAMTGGTVTGPDLECTIGAASAERFSARPIEGSFAEIIALSRQVEEAEAAGRSPSPETIAALVTFYADFLTAFESTPMTLGGLSCSGTDEAGTGITLSSGPLSIGAFIPGRYPEIALDDFRIEVAGQGWLEFANFTWKPMDLNGPLAALVAAKDNLTEAWFEENWRKVIPAIEGFSLSGLALDVPDTENPGKRVTFSVGAMDLSLSDYTNGIPATIAANGEGIVVDLPETGEGAELRRFGYETLDLGYGIAARWDEAGETILLDRFSVSGEGMGSVTLSGVIGNAGAELFALDPHVAEVAAAALTVRELTIEIENAGLAPVLIALIAAEEDQEPQVFHVALAGLARALPLAVLGATPEALGVSNALGAFMDGAPNLTIRLTSVDPAGIGLAELMAAEKDPAVLQGKIAIAAEASGEPVAFTWPEPVAEEPETEASPPAPTENPRSRAGRDARS